MSARVPGTFSKKLPDRRETICVAVLVDLFGSSGLRACHDCGAPYCRECGEHATYVHSLRPSPGVAGYECVCGWAVSFPRFGTGEEMFDDLFGDAEGPG
jgi:hypothetical protein